MTYVSDDRDTALAETAGVPGTFAVGEFIIERDLSILDLTQLPAVPSIFAEIPDSLEYDPRPRTSFLRDVSDEISRPIARDDRVHVEYVPTQVVTEYLRTAVKINRKSVDGIRYRSSRQNVGTALVLFADRENLVLEANEQPPLYQLYTDRWLRLQSASVTTVTNQDIENWKRVAAATHSGLFPEAT
jgi:hypothetical protein